MASRLVAIQNLHIQDTQQVTMAKCLHYVLFSSNLTCINNMQCRRHRNAQFTTIMRIMSNCL